MARVLLFLLLITTASMGSAAVSVKAMRGSAEGQVTRVVFDLSGAAPHSVFTLDNPDRVVVDLKDAGMEASVASAFGSLGLVQRVRTGVRQEKDLRVVFDLSGQARVKSFLLKPEADAPHRLVVEFQAATGKAGSPAPVMKAPVARDLVIAIDAGHGGNDPGAIGPRGTHEKKITLAVAHKLAQLIAKEPGMKPLLIRSDDRYLPLRHRKEKARDHRADMFISLHADAVNHPNARGASVYTLSPRGASTEAARLLAERENSADLIGGVVLDDKDSMVAQVILDLSRAATIESSLQLADSILKELGGVGRVHKAEVEQAGFVVLKSLDMPSVLVELAFISNPEEERRLNNEAHQWKLARAILAGMKNYRDRHMPQTPRMAEDTPRQYVVRAGDTLSGIAARHEVSTDRLRDLNRVVGDHLEVGRQLVIPQ